MVRRFEYIGGGSEKFWEIHQDGTSVTVHFGRIGTAGQTQVKELGTDTAAATHAAKLVAEKVKKGYVEAGTVDPPAVTVAEPVDVPERPADEDTWTVPPAWWRHTEPFRGRGPERASATVDPAALPVAAELLAFCQPQLHTALENPQSDPELVERARRFLGGYGNVDALGAAAVGAMAARTVDWGRRAKLPAIADAWVASHGLVLAAEAGALMGEVEAADTSGWNAYNPTRELVLRRPQGELMGMFWVQPMLARLRALLASAGETEYATAVERLARLRSSPEVGVRVVTSYLLPTEQPWLDQTVSELATAGLSVRTLVLLLLSTTNAAQAMAILDAADFTSIRTDTTDHYSLAAHIGPDAASALDRLLDGYLDAEGKRQILSIIARLPGDTAFGVLLRRLDQKYVQPALLDAMSQFPQRAMRLLPAVAAGSGPRAAPAEDLLRTHIISHPGLVGPARETLAGAPAELLDGLAVAGAATRIAARDELPAILATPPWEARRASAKPLVVEGLGPPSPLTLAWKRGEQAAWDVDDGGLFYGYRNVDWRQQLAAASGSEGWRQIHIFAAAPTELVRPLLRNATPARTFMAGPALRRVLARFGDDATDFVVRAAAGQPAALAGVLLPIHGSEVAARMAEWYVGSKRVRPTALAWFDRHAAAAARDLVPPALGKPGRERTAAEVALRVLDQRGQRDEILATARAYGPEAAEEIYAALSAVPMQILPARIPARPSWLDPAHLSPVLLREGCAALPPSAVDHVCTMLALSRPGATYAGVEVVRQAVDPGSLAEMAWSVFERWQGAGYPSKDGWVLEALGLVGDDETVRRLAPLIRAWPGESAHARAVAGLDVLSAIGSDIALMHLYGIAQKAKFKGLKTKAQEKMEKTEERSVGKE
jgi:predicted DNA-binding WGR domain protein